MGRIIQELERSLPGLSKAVFSQSIDKLSDEKVVIRPVSTKTGIAYQAESFRNNKAFHRNLTADALLRYAEEELGMTKISSYQIEYLDRDESDTMQAVQNEDSDLGFAERVSKVFSVVLEYFK